MADDFDCNGYPEEAFPPEPADVPFAGEEPPEVGGFPSAFSDFGETPPAPEDPGLAFSTLFDGLHTEADSPMIESAAALEPQIGPEIPVASPGQPYPFTHTPKTWTQPPAPPQYAADPWRRPAIPAYVPPVEGNTWADAPPGYERPRYDRPIPAADPWRPRTAASKRKNGWKIGFICLLLAALFFTGAVVISAGQTDLWPDFQNPLIPETSPPFGRTPAPADEPDPGAPNISGNAPMDASGGTSLEIVDRPSNTAPPEAGQPLTIRQIAEKALPSVVGILAGSEDEYSMSSGSGVIMTADGYVITNNHVVSGYRDVSVVLYNGETYQVTQVRTDYTSDLAVLKIDAAGLTPAEFGNSDLMAVGDLAVAIGSPLGMELQSTVTNGIISAINRDIVIDDLSMTMLQTNCAINPGNSGGPLINEYGQVVGIISSKIMSDYYSASVVEGLGFAIPSNTVDPIVNELITRGYVKGRPAIGITGQTIDQATARYMGVPQGFQVVDINPACDAYKQGLRVDDIITRVFDQPVTTVGEINAIKNENQVGDSLTITVYRPSERRSLEITFMLMDSGEMG